jgi:hypothetical protein
MDTHVHVEDTQGVPDASAAGAAARGSTAGVGYSDDPRSYEAGVDAATQALETAGLGRCDLVLLFSTPKQDPVALRDGVRSVVGPHPRLIGGYAVGVITNERLGYDGHQVGVVVISSDTVDFDAFIEPGLPDNEYEVGMALGKQIAARDYRGTPNLLLMYDSVKQRASEGLSLNQAQPLLRGVEQSLEQWPPTAGAGLFGDMEWNPTYQWFDDRIERGTALALVLSGRVRMDTTIMHGLKPGSDYHTITKADGTAVLEIDDLPAVDFIADLVGRETSWEDYPLFVTLGVNKGERFGPFREEDYANKLVMAVDKERGALIMFEADLQAGTEVQVMRRSVDLDYIGRRCEELLSGLGDRRPFLALYLDCCGRACTYSGAEREEAEEVQKAIGDRMPLLGLYSGVEIAEVGGRPEPLDWNGVLCVFSE